MDKKYFVNKGKTNINDELCKAIPYGLYDNNGALKLPGQRGLGRNSPIKI
ncbi:hypothetical protein [Cellvibrio mixtus]|nr:hypothetical protein [Cellvibrio mixtus]